MGWGFQDSPSIQFRIQFKTALCQTKLREGNTGLEIHIEKTKNYFLTARVIIFSFSASAKNRSIFGGL